VVVVVVLRLVHASTMHATRHSEMSRNEGDGMAASSHRIVMSGRFGAVLQQWLYVRPRWVSTGFLPRVTAYAGGRTSVNGGSLRYRVRA